MKIFLASFLLLFAQLTFVAPISLAAEDSGETGASDSQEAKKKDTSYKQNPDGSWSNDDYTWNPDTKQTKPNNPTDYSYNPSTEHWDTKDWAYQNGKYVPNPKSGSTGSGNTAAGSSRIPVKTGAPQGSTAATNSLQADGGQAKSMGAMASPQANAGGSGSNLAQSGKTTGVFDLFFDASISNVINSEATSGDALVAGNTAAGSALTGDAQALVNVLNLLQSSWGQQSDSFATFVANLDGNLYGDLYIDPSALAQNVNISDSKDVDVNVAANSLINNDINLSATSGDATVENNTKAGDATSGNATAMANIINMINSAINAGQSFIGTVNINGSYDGDILLPASLLDAILNSSGPNSVNNVAGSAQTDVNVNSETNRSINNNVNSQASSGNAVVDGNTIAGSATTGQALTSVNSLDYIGQDYSGQNGLLVLINVLGTWMGLSIVPGSAQIAGGGPSGPNSENNSALTTDTDVDVNQTENSVINNNVNVAATSGDATVQGNTEAGSATTGQAKTSVNLVNMIGSTVNVDEWFGVLFINVFGDWLGNFGINGPNGNPQEQIAGTGANTNNQSSASASTQSGRLPGPVLAFVGSTSAGNGGLAATPTLPANSYGSGSLAENSGQTMGALTPDENSSGGEGVVGTGASANNPAAGASKQSFLLRNVLFVGSALSLLIAASMFRGDLVALARERSS